MARSDTMRYIRKLSVGKAFNHFKVYSSYQWSRLTGKPAMWGYPVAISVEPTTACNLGCPECPSGLKQFSRPTGNLKDEDFKSWIDQLRQHVSYLTFYFQGEPFIHPNFLELVNYASERGMYTATSTNAHFLDSETARKTVESGLDRLIISIDGTTQEVYENYRVNGKLDKVLEGTRNIVDWKRKLKKGPHIIFQFLVVRPNEHQIEEVFQLASEMGVDEVRLKTAQIYDYENGNSLIPENEKYSRYKRQPDGSYKIKNSFSNECWRMWHSCVITWDGKVVPCCFDKDATHQMGSLQSNTMKEIWNGEHYNSFRQAVAKSRSEIEICANCSEGTKVWT